MCRQSPRMRHLDRRSQCTVRVVRRSFRLIDAAAIYRVRQWTIPPHFFFARVFTRNIFLDHVMFHAQCTQQVFETGNQNCESCSMKYTCAIIIYYDDLFVWTMICNRWYVILPLNTHEVIATVPILLFTKWKGREAVATERYRNAYTIIFHQRRFNNLIWRHTIVGCYYYILINVIASTH